MAKYLSGPPGGRTLPQTATRLSDLAGGVYGAGASVASTGVNTQRPAVKAGIARAAGETWNDVVEYYSVMLQLELVCLTDTFPSSLVLSGGRLTSHTDSVRFSTTEASIPHQEASLREVKALARTREALNWRASTSSGLRDKFGLWTLLQQPHQKTRTNLSATPLPPLPTLEECIFAARVSRRTQSWRKLGLSVELSMVIESVTTDLASCIGMVSFLGRKPTASGRWTTSASPLDRNLPKPK